MPPRDDELPEGTDQIINGAMETDPDAGVGSSAAAGGGVTDQLKSQVSSLRDQAGGRVREFADTGKSRATDLLEELSRVVADTADSIDERLGNNYGEYARKAADGVSNLAESLRGKEVDELYDNVRDAVRKSPGVAIGIAAVLGFTLVRLAKAGLPDQERSGNDGGSGA